MTAAPSTIEHTEQGGDVAVELIDADIHPYPRSFDDLLEYMPEPWRSQGWVDQFAAARGYSIYVSPGPDAGMRADALPPGGGPAASDPRFVEKELFDDLGIDFGILIPLTVTGMANPEHESALCTATNAWLADTWLSKYNGHGRYRGSLTVCHGDPVLAVREIERWAGHPYFVQVTLLPYARAPFGQAFYRPIIEAAARHDLPLAIHVNRTPGMALLTPVGFVSYYSEHHPHYSLLYAPHLVSLIVEGVFEKFPSLKLVLVEGGFSWIAPVTWRLDRLWEEFHSEVPELRRRPSDYVRDHVRVTSQPVEEPANPRHLDAFLEWIDAEQTLMFASDYPHWDFDDPRQLIRQLPKRGRERILRDNALELYKLPPTRAESAGT